MGRYQHLPAEGGLSVYFRDITERRQADEHRELLIHELNHRAKNTLATLQSIAAQAMRKSDVMGEMRADFESRLFALSRAHDVLTRENWKRRL
ncbi:HWE histidine kinase domain-containing protein [Microvirga sp. 2TAF3]|uniref:HWE histidine kinase domain-containing protein n=1 Tax=Microvirga sp. 2TAF3 TaxID=3233014 RepID=UPI003F94C535